MNSMASPSNPAFTRMNIPLTDDQISNDDALSIMSYDRYHIQQSSSSSSFQAPASQQRLMYGESSSGGGASSSPNFQLPEFPIHTPSLQNNQTAIEFSRVYEQHCRDILSFIHADQLNNASILQRIQATGSNRANMLTMMIGLHIDGIFLPNASRPLSKFD